MTTLTGSEVVAMVDALVALLDPSPESVGRILGTTFAPGRRSEYLDGMFAQGPFEKANLRYDQQSRAGMLMLDGRLDSGVVATNVDLRKYGPPPPANVPSPTHFGDFEGYYSLSYTPAPRVELCFQFTQRTKRLYKIVVEWDRT
jgi:hypothetical protein